MASPHGGLTLPLRTTLGGCLVAADFAIISHCVWGGEPGEKEVEEVGNGSYSGMGYRKPTKALNSGQARKCFLGFVLFFPKWR